MIFRFADYLGEARLMCVGPALALLLTRMTNLLAYDLG